MEGKGGKGRAREGREGEGEARERKEGEGLKGDQTNPTFNLIINSNFQPARQREREQTTTLTSTHNL